MSFDVVFCGFVSSPTAGFAPTFMPHPGWFLLPFLLAFWAGITPVAAMAQTLPGEPSTPTSFESLAESAAAAREAGRADQSLRDYQDALAIHPDWAEGWWYVGMLLYDADRYQDAIPAFHRLVQLAPKLGPAWNFLGLCEYERKDYTSALTHLEKGRELGSGEDPEIARVSAYHLGLLLIRNGDFERGSATLLSTVTRGQMPPQVKTALALAILRVPLLPEEIDPSRDALLQAAGNAAADLARNDPATALDVFPKLLSEYPDTPYLHYAYGLALASEGRPQAAMEQQKKEATISSDSALPWIQLAALQLQVKHPDDALRAAQRAMQLAPDSAAAHRTLSQALKAVGRDQQAGEELQRAEYLTPEKPQPEARIASLYAHRSEAGAAKPAAKASSKQSLDRFDELARQAAAAAAVGDISASIRLYRQALQQRLDWKEGRWSLAMLCYSTARYSEAVSTLKDFLASDPNNGTAWAVMGLSEFESRDYSNAIIHLQRGRELGFGGSPQSVQLANYRLGLLLIHSGQFDSATEVLSDDQSSGPLAKEIEFSRGMALLQMALFPEQVEASKSSLVEECGEIAVLLTQSRYDDAFTKFQELLKLHPKAPFLHYSYGKALIALSQYDEAQEQMRNETKISPASPLPYIRLASIALRQHQPADALAPAQQALQLAPDSAEAHYLLGRANLELGHTETAVAELEKASAQAPGSPEVHYNLAKAYARANLPDKAEQERMTFTRLNALAEEQRSHQGNQSYSGPRDASGFSSARNKPAQAGSSDTHPQ
jgi:tetratricopeptide (TPR) repeat protein